MDPTEPIQPDFAGDTFPDHNVNAAGFTRAIDSFFRKRGMRSSLRKLNREQLERERARMRENDE